MNPYTHPDFKKSALITIDTQNDFVLDNAPFKIEGTLSIIPQMSQLVKEYRKTDRPIVHIIRIYLPDGSNADLCRKEIIEKGDIMAASDTPGAELVQDLKPYSGIRLDALKLLKGEFQQIGKNEYILYKPRWGAFYQTALGLFLRQRSINTLVFSGCNYPNCPRTSIYEASERDFKVVLATDAVSQLYTRGEQELSNIGVTLLKTDEITQKLKNLHEKK